MPDCVGYVTHYYKRDGEAKAKSQACKVTIAHPSPSWVQLTATVDDKAVRLSIEMGEFEKLVLKMDELLQAEVEGGSE